MIKKVIGIVVAMAAIVVIVAVALRGDQFTSLIFKQTTAVEPDSAPVQNVLPDSLPAAAVADSLVQPDSLPVHELQN